MKYITALVVLLISHSTIAQQTTSACNLEQHTQFDFWVGNWRVTAGDKHAGSNVIEKIEDGCVIREQWSSGTSSYTGTSYNFYNQEDKQWEQLWLDNQGGVLKLKGNRIGKQMILQSDASKNAAGENVTQRISWTLNDNGSVQQLWQVLTEGQDTQVAFDGLYVKAN